MSRDPREAADLYEKFQHSVLPAYYDAPSTWTRIMQQAIALNASFFNAHRMAQQYAAHAHTLSAAGRPSVTTGE